MKYTRKICALLLALLTLLSVLAAAAPSRNLLSVSAMEKKAPAVSGGDVSAPAELPTVPRGGKYSQYEWQRSGSLEYVIDSGRAVVVSCDRDASGTVAIPYRMGNCSVAAIADYAFSGCSGITEIVLPLTVDYIGNCAFAGCSALGAINLDLDRVELGYDPFCGCPSGIVTGRTADGGQKLIGSLDAAAPALTAGGPAAAVDKATIRYYDQIIEAIRKGLSVYEGNIDLVGFEVTSEELYYITDNIRAELPLETAAAGIWGWSATGGGESDNGFVRSLQFGNDYDPKAETYQQRYDKLAAKINPFIESMKGYSVYDRIFYSHEFIVNCGSYDRTLTYYQPYEYLIKGTGVCQSYTMAYAILLDLMDIPNSRVVSSEMDHTWNIVWIDGEPYHIDATWDDPYGNSTSYSLTHYLLNDSEMLNEDHYSWSPDYSCDSTVFSSFERGYVPSSAVYCNGLWYQLSISDYNTCLYSCDIYGGSKKIIDPDAGASFTGLTIYNDILYYVSNLDSIKRYYINSGKLETLCTLTDAERNSCYYDSTDLSDFTIDSKGILTYNYDFYINDNGVVDLYTATSGQTFDVSRDHDFVIPATTLEAHSVGYTSAKLTWEPVDYVDGYNIYRCDRAGQPYKLVASVDRTKNTYTNTALSTGTTYYYKVKAYCLTGSGAKVEGPFSNYHTARPLPATPVVTAVRTSPTSVSIGWVRIYGATGYSVYRSETENGTYAFYAAMASGDDTYYVDKNASKTYYYKVRAYRAMGEDKMFGSYSKATPAPVSKLSAPAITARSVGYTSARIEWSEVPGADGYSLYRCDVGGGTYSFLTSVDANTRTYTNTGLSTGTTYYYKVRAYVNVGGEKVFSPYTPCATARPIPATPVVTVRLTDEADAVVVEWVPIYGATGYSVYISTSKDGDYTFYTNLPGGYYNGLITSNLMPKGTYYFKVRAYREMGSDRMFSNYSTPKGITVPWTDFHSGPAQQTMKEQ